MMISRGWDVDWAKGNYVEAENVETLNLFELDLTCLMTQFK